MKNFKAWLPAAAWMALIFFMSAAPGEVSGEQSGLIVDIILFIHRSLFGQAQLSSQTLTLLETLVRKAAHMGEYAVLALLYAHALTKNGTRRPVRIALLLCLLYAVTDECHQAFVPDRGPSPIDVMIDTLGASIGLALRTAALRLFRRTPA